MMKKLIIIFAILFLTVPAIAKVGLYGNPTPIVISKTRNSPVLIKLYDIDNTVFLEAEIDAITKVEVKYIPASGEDSESTDSVACADCFDTSTFAEWGEISVDLGSVAFTAGRDRSAELIIYTATYTEGYVAGLLDIRISEDAIRDATMIDPVTASIALNDLSDVSTSGASTGQFLQKTGAATYAFASASGAGLGDMLEANYDTEAEFEDNLFAVLTPGEAEMNPDLVSQEDAEAGTSETEFSWSPLRVYQAIAALATGTGAVDSVNGETGTVVLDADDIDDTSATNKWVTQALINAWNAVVTFPGFGTSHETAAYGDHDHSGVYDVSGAASTAESNANSYSDGLASNYATSTQGSTADTAIQPGDTVQTNSGTTLPATCTVGEMFLDTDADTNGSLYLCIATDTWKEMDDDGAAGGGGDLLADGTVPMTSNWDIGAYIITGLRFISDVATGTAPFQVASTTVVPNLNADLLDGESASAFEDADGTILKQADVDDVPVDGVTTAPISSNRMYDHENASNPHGVSEDQTVSNTGDSDIQITGTYPNFTFSFINGSGFLSFESDPRLPAHSTSGNILRSTGSAWESWTPTFLTPSFTGSSNIVTVGTLSSGSIPYSLLSGTPSSLTPTAHASTHATGQSDAIAPADIGAEPADAAIVKSNENETITGTWALGSPTATTPAEDDNDTSVATTAFVQTEIAGLSVGTKTTHTFTSTDTLSAPECTNSIISNRGQSSEITLTLGTPAAGMGFLAIVVTPAQTYHLKAPAGYYINFDGDDLDVADKVSNGAAAAAAGDCIIFYTAQDASGDWTWYAVSVIGTWSDGGV